MRYINRNPAPRPHERTPHEFYLESLISRIHEIGEDPRNIDWIMKEGIWYRPNHEQSSMPDIIACYKNKDFLVAELKGSKNQRSKARGQIESGVRFVESHMDYNRIFKKFVVYDRGHYYWERM